ncbi:MAG: PLP-dependent aminotransferase family protein [Polyangiaceae bacterium]|nr:PLP-dependent aminotransferase family protein [Myxococcales bacterium]MCB9585634.1 PLP-dependent aminotransferase family protein [Polyangiaceae bacterium]
MSSRGKITDRARDASEDAQLSAPARVEQLLRARCAAGRAGQRLPSVRELMRELGASPVTISRALKQLELEGLLQAQPGAGTFIAAKKRERPSLDFAWQSLVLGAAPPAAALHALVSEVAPGSIQLASGYADASLIPVKELSRAARSALNTGSGWDRAPLSGLPELRSWFALRVGADYAADDVLIVQGGQAAIHSVFRAVTRPAGGLLVESPTYVGAIEVARALGVELVPVPCDEHGVVPEFLERAFEQSRASAFYCQPLHQNPTGSVLLRERRAEVLDIARRHSAFVIEDDYARGLSFEPAPPTLASEAPGQVIYIRSLTKCTAPSLRVAAICGKGPVLERVATARVLEDFFVPRLLQETALGLVSSSGFERHLARLGRVLEDRMTVLQTELAARLPSWRTVVQPRGGFNLWLELPGGTSAVELGRRAASVGVRLNPGASWFPAEPISEYVRLSVAAATVPEIRLGVERLALANVS